MKRLFIGDIHGDLKLVRFLLKNFSQYRLCFLGDIVDTFQPYTIQEQIECMRLILNYDCDLIRGNHDEHYLYSQMRCSGWKSTTNYLLRPLHDTIINRSKYYLYLKDQQLLVTHAGLSKALWDRTCLTLDNLEEVLSTWITKPAKSPIHWIGHSRGGIHSIPGILWCDYNVEFKPIDGLKQVFGHTLWIDKSLDANRSGVTNGIRSIGKNYNIDCLEREYEFLEFDEETGDFATVRLPKEWINESYMVT